MGVGTVEAGKANPLQHGGGRGRRRRAPGTEGNVGGDGPPREQARLLEDDGAAGIDVGDDPVAEADLTAGGSVEARDQAQ